MLNYQDYTLYFDEAGYTGSDLTNEKQPYFCMASCLYTVDELQQIKSDLSLTDINKELHFSKLVASRNGQRILIELLRHPLINYDRIITSFVHKRFCIYAQIVNTLIETYLIKYGYNIYRDNRHRDMANLLYYGAILHPDKDEIKCLENQFVEMMRFRNLDAINQFFDTVMEMLIDPDTDADFRKILSLVYDSQDVLDDVLVDDKFYLDNTVSSFVSQLSIWHTRKKVKFDVCFDNSKPIEDKLDLLLRLRDIPRSKESQILSTEAFVLPLPFNNISMVDSAEYFGIQIADVIASALCYYACGKLSSHQNLLTEIEKHSFFTTPSWSVCPMN